MIAALAQNSGQHEDDIYSFSTACDIFSWQSDSCIIKGILFVNHQGWLNTALWGLSQPSATIKINFIFVSHAQNNLIFKLM